MTDVLGKTGWTPEPQPFRLSATRLKKFLTCPRAYFLSYVQRVPEDVRGNYLVVGNAYDQHVQWYLSSGARGCQSIDPKIVRMFAAAKRHLPAPGSVEVQREYSVQHPDGFVVEGKPDLRRPGWLGDTKTCASREWALTPATLATNEQALLYAWCEFELGYDDAAVTAVWSYVTKATKPEAWNVRTDLLRPAVHAWFEDVARPAAAQMALLHAENDAARVVANLDACERCWVKAHCSPYDGPNNYDAVDGLIPAASLKRIRPLSSAEKANGEGTMAFDLKQLSANTNETLESQLQASIDAVVDRAVTATVVKASGTFADGLEFTHSGVVEVGSTGAGSPAIAINPPVRPRKPKAPAPTVVDPVQVNLEDLASELQTCVDTCNGAISRIDRLLAQLRGGK